jgi:polysaccharide biosynthesis PFTS motif protein
MDFGNWYSSQTEQGVQLTFIYFSSNNESKVIKYGKRDVFCKNFAKFDFGISGKSKITLILYSIGLLIKSIRELCTGKCESFVCFYELILSKRYSIVQKNELPDKLLFSDSHGVLMPIWVNQLMKLGVTVDYLFFSSYDSPTLYYEEDPRQDFWKLNSWPNLICVDQYQSDFIKKNLMYSDQNVEVKGFPYFNDNNYVFNDSDRFVISLFDFEPSEGLLGLSTISECGYNSFQVNEKFLSTIYFIAQELDALILHKPKRKSTLENRSHEYVRFINGLDPFFYKSLPPEVSPARLILNSDCTISMPITTPGLIAKKYGRNSIFFDPSGKISQDDPALRKTLFTNDSIKLMKILKNFKNNRFENY